MRDDRPHEILLVFLNLAPRMIRSPCSTEASGEIVYKIPDVLCRPAVLTLVLFYSESSACKQLLNIPGAAGDLSS
jgi:hypothetical protein